MCEFSLTPLVNDVGDLISVIAQCRDITQQLEAERLKKEFTSTLSHELRTPLTSISSTTSWPAESWDSIAAQLVP